MNTALIALSIAGGGIVIVATLFYGIRSLFRPGGGPDGKLPPIGDGGAAGFGGASDSDHERRTGNWISDFFGGGDGGGGGFDGGGGGGDGGGGGGS